MSIINFVELRGTHTIYTELKSKELIINFHMNSEPCTRSGKTNYNIHITHTGLHKISFILINFKRQLTQT
jgi:S-methylmethionine-dependent homocysteine/selenocysteine methylase